MELNETQRYFIEEHVEDFRDGFMRRRELGRRVTLLAGGQTAGAGILAACDMTPRPASGGAPAASAAPSATPVPSPSPYAPPPAQVSTTGITVQPTDPRIAASTPDVKGADGASLMAYMARPAGSARVPGVIVIHENRGQLEHIKDVVRRVATAGFVGINIDLAARAGGAVKLADSAAYNAELAKRSTADKLSDHNATLAFLKSQSTGAIGVVGFCFGGGEVWNLVISGADLKAAVPFYGPQPPNFADLAKTKTAVSAVYAAQDTRITGTAPDVDDRSRHLHQPERSLPAHARAAVAALRMPLRHVTRRSAHPRVRVVPRGPRGGRVLHGHRVAIRRDLRQGRAEHRPPDAARLDTERQARPVEHPDPRGRDARREACGAHEERPWLHRRVRGRGPQHHLRDRVPSRVQLHDRPGGDGAHPSELPRTRRQRTPVSPPH